MLTTTTSSRETNLNLYLLINNSTEREYLYLKGKNLPDALSMFKQSCESQGYEYSTWLDDCNYQITDVSNNIGVFYMMNLLDPKIHNYTTYAYNDTNIKFGDCIFTDKTDISHICLVKSDSIQNGYEAIHTILKSNNVPIPDWLQPNNQKSECNYVPPEGNFWCRSIKL